MNVVDDKTGNMCNLLKVTLSYTDYKDGEVYNKKVVRDVKDVTLDFDDFDRKISYKISNGCYDTPYTLVRNAKFCNYCGKRMQENFDFDEHIKNNYTYCDCNKAKRFYKLRKQLVKLNKEYDKLIKEKLDDDVKERHLYELLKDKYE